MSDDDRMSFGRALAKFSQDERLQEARKPDPSRSSNVDFEDCNECCEYEGSGICANCEADGGYCPVDPPGCGGSGNCCECQGSGRRPIELDRDFIAQVEAAGPLITPDEGELDATN